MDTRSEKEFVFLPYRQIEKNFYALVDKELAYHGKQFVDELPAPRNTQLFSIYTWFSQLTQFGVSDKLKSRLATAAIIELKKNIYGEYGVFSPEGGWLNWGSFVYKNIDKTIGITAENFLSTEEAKKLQLLLARERENIVAKSSVIEELQKELDAKRVDDDKEKSQPKIWDESSAIEVMKPESALMQKFYLWAMVHRDVKKHYNDKNLYTAGIRHFRSCQQPVLTTQPPKKSQTSTDIIPLTKQLKN